MNKNPLKQGMIEQNFNGIGEISDDMLTERADQLALIAGRPVTHEDKEQALRELTGGNSMDPDQFFLESMPEEDRWNPIASSTGDQAEETASEDEDEDGQNESALLFEEGVSEASHDQMLQAAIVEQQIRQNGE